MTLLYINNKKNIKGLVTFTFRTESAIDIIFICSIELRKGIGTKLIKELAEYAIKNKASVIYSAVSSGDKGVMKFYKNCGFRRYGKPYVEMKLVIYPIKASPKKILRSL